MSVKNEYSNESITKFLFRWFQFPRKYGKLLLNFVLSKRWYIYDVIVISGLICAIFVWWNLETIKTLSSLPENSTNYLFYAFLHLLFAHDQKDELIWEQLYDNLTQIGWTSVMISVGLTFIYYFIRWNLFRNKRKIPSTEDFGFPAQSKIIQDTSYKELIFGAVIPLFGVLFFLYQMIAGAFFATTSIEIEKIKWVKNNKLLVTASIERGDKWLVAIALDQYAIVTDSTFYPFQNGTNGNNLFKFPRRENKLLRLAPGEKMTADFLVDVSACSKILDEDKTPLFLSMSVLSYALFWPVSSESLTIASIPNKEFCS